MGTEYIDDPFGEVYGERGLPKSYGENSHVEPYKLCDFCQRFVGGLEFLSLPCEGFQRDWSSYVPRMDEHYPDTASLLSGARNLCHWCNLIVGRIRTDVPRIFQLEETPPGLEEYPEGSIIAEIWSHEEGHRYICLTYWQITKNKEEPLRLCNFLELHPMKSDTCVQDMPKCHKWVTSMASNQVCESINNAILRCQQEHRLCNYDLLARPGFVEGSPNQESKTAMERMPTRLIDIDPQETDDDLRLVLSQNTGEVEYVTLSYSWGGLKPFVLTNENYETCLHGFNIDSLPRTLQDAVYLTRKLKRRYIWIDSICIKQHDYDDWIQEGTRMGEIYSNSALTLAASDSRSCDAGLSFFRNPLQTHKCILSESAGVDWYLDALHCGHSALLDAVLQNRGWAFQERVLSPPTVHLGQSVLRWDCRESFDCEVEDHLTKCNCTLRRNMKTWVDLLLKEKDCAKERMSKFRENWNMLLDKYYTTDLSNWEDRSIAFSGLGKSLTSLSGFTCSFGMWLELMPDCLTWTAYGPREKRQANFAPSWSWMSLKPKLKRKGSFITQDRFHENREVLGYHRTSYKAQVMRYPKEKRFDQRTVDLLDNADYRIRLRCPIAPGHFEVTRHGDPDPKLILPIAGVVPGSPLVVDWDDDDDKPTNNGEPTRCLLLTSYRGQPRGTKAETYLHDLLVLRPRTKNASVLRRVGITTLKSNLDCSNWNEDEVEIE